MRVAFKKMIILIFFYIKKKKKVKVHGGEVLRRSGRAVGQIISRRVYTCVCACVRPSIRVSMCARVCVCVHCLSAAAPVVPPRTRRPTPARTRVRTLFSLPLYGFFRFPSLPPFLIIFLSFVTEPPFLFSP